MSTFIIRQEQYLTPCAELLDQDKRGLIGFHDWGSCPNCKLKAGPFVAMEVPDKGTVLGPVVNWDDDPELLAKRLQKQWPGIPVFRSPAKLTFRA